MITDHAQGNNNNNNNNNPPPPTSTYLTSEDLEESLKEMIADGTVSASEAFCLRVQRRRTSVDLHMEAGEDPRLSVPASDPSRLSLVVVGTESMTLHGEEVICRGTNCGELTPIPIDYTALNGHRMIAPVMPWLVSCDLEDDKSEAVRYLCYRSAAVIVIFYSVRHKQSLLDVANRWVPEVRDCFKDTEAPPIVLVGTHAEDDRTREVPSNSAIELARELGVAKYLEIFSTHAAHAHEVYVQSIQSILSTYDVVSIDEYFTLFAPHAREDVAVWREFMTAPTPRVHFDLYERTLHVDVDEIEDKRFATKIRLYLDGVAADEMEYTDPIQLSPVPQMPKTVTVSVCRRCHFPSDAIVVDVPPVTPNPAGQFDVFSGRFYLLTEPNTTYYYTTDGSKPNPVSSNVYTRSLTSSSGVVIRVVAMQSGSFRSKIVDFAPPEALPSPKVCFVAAEGVLSIDTVPYLEYRYTVDGSAPAYDTVNNPSSMVYTRPVLIPKEKYAHIAHPKIRVAVFPRLYYPSKVVEVPLAPPKSNASCPVVNVNKTAMNRIHRTHSPGSNNNNKSNINNNSNLHSSSPRPSPARSTSASRARMVQGKRTTSSPSPAPAAPPVGCRAEENTVRFNFPAPIHLSHLTITTPGRRRGPDQYELAVRTSPKGFSADSFVVVGSGFLKDVKGVQRLGLHPTAEAVCVDVVEVRCTFQADNSANTFEIVDMKVHGKPTTTATATKRADDDGVYEE
eukprot:PhM_4_TR10328/c2_g1_i1/m.20045